MVARAGDQVECAGALLRDECTAVGFCAWDRIDGRPTKGQTLIVQMRDFGGQATAGGEAAGLTLWGEAQGLTLSTPLAEQRPYCHPGETRRRGNIQRLQRRRQRPPAVGRVRGYAEHVAEDRDGPILHAEDDAAE